MSNTSKEFHAFTFTDSDLESIPNHFNDKRGFVIEDIDLGLIESEIVTKACKKYAENIIKEFIACSAFYVHVENGEVVKASMITCGTKELTSSDIESYDETDM